MKTRSILAQTPLFDGIRPEEYDAMLACIGGRESRFARHDFISLTGDHIDSIGVVLSGRVQILKEDVFGNRAILNELVEGEIFGESFICGGAASLGVSIQAAESSTILFLSFDKVMRSCSSACEYHTRLIQNMVVLLAQKNMQLVEKLEITTKHSLREKVLAYLSMLSRRQNSATVTSPLGRTDLADFLGADRSALTRELGRMQRDGLLRYDKNTFELLGI